MKLRSAAAFLTAVCGLLPCLAPAAKVKVWHHGTPGNYDKAQLKGAVVSNEGALRLSRQLRPLASLDAAHVWDIIEDRDGNLFVATGDDGKIYKVTPAGEATVVYTADDSQVLCLAPASDGSIYAGTGPAGHLLRLTPDGKAEIVGEALDSYIWCLAVDPGGTVYAGTGPQGRIYQVSPQGKAKLYYATKQEHILCLAIGPDRTLYAGTDKNGLVYRFDAHGKAFVVYSAPQSEVRRLLVGPDGVYACTSAPRQVGGSSRADVDRPATSSYAAALTSASRSATRAAAEDTGKAGTTSTSAAAKDKEDKGRPAPSLPPPSSGENSVYRIAADGTVREVFRAKALILSLLRLNGRLFVGTGMEGQLFEVDEATREHSEVARLDHGQVQCLYRRRDGSVVLGTGDPGKLYVLQDRYTPRGTVVSEVLDAKMISRWGALRWKADTPAGTHVTVAVRGGNLAEPDETWSDWSAEQTDAEKAVAVAPPARFLQYRVTLTTDNPAVTPALRSLALRYMTVNQAPEVTAVEVPDLDAVNLDNPKKLKLKWSALDPNEDELTYSLYVRKEGWSDWVRLEEDLDKREYEWDTTMAPAGMYRLKVVASDRRDNAPEDALTGERVSAPFAVAHTPPVVTLKVASVEGGRAVVEATAADELVRLTSAAFAVNGRKWVNVFPTDGLFDSKRATFRFTTEVLKPGTYVIVLRVRDAAANTGSADVVFTVPEQTVTKRK